MDFYCLIGEFTVGVLLGLLAIVLGEKIQDWLYSKRSFDEQHLDE